MVWLLKGLRVQKLLESAERKEKSGDLQAALDDYRQTVQLAPKHEQALMGQARVLAEMKRYDEAWQVLQGIPDLEEHPSARVTLGDINYARGNFGEALRYFEGVSDSGIDLWTRLFWCFLSLGDIERARDTLERWQRQDYARPVDKAIRGVLRRWEELSVEFPGVSPRQYPVKERVYCLHAAACIGTRDDDGIHIPEYAASTLDWEAVAVTLRRFLNFAKRFSWGFDVVAGVDETSQPMAIALSRFFRNSKVKKLDELQLTDRVLLVQAVAKEANTFTKARSQSKADRILGFILGGHAAVDMIGGWTPDVVGIVASVSVPWEVPPLGAPAVAYTAEAAADELVQAMTAIDDDPNRAEQIDWYVTKHRRVRFLGG